MGERSSLSRGHPTEGAEGGQGGGDRRSMYVLSEEEEAARAVQVSRRQDRPRPQGEAADAGQGPSSSLGGSKGGYELRRGLGRTYPTDGVAGTWARVPLHGLRCLLGGVLLLNQVVLQGRGKRGGKGNGEVMERTT